MSEKLEYLYESIEIPNSFTPLSVIGLMSNVINVITCALCNILACRASC